MAVQAQLYSDHYQNHNNHNNNNMPFSNLPQDWVFSSASSVFQFGDEHQEHLQDQKFLINSSSGYHNNQVSSSISRFGRMNGLQDLSSELEKQRLEMDCFLHFQNEKLKAVLNQEARNREVIMMQSYESKMKSVIEEKDEALNAAKIRTRELESYLLMAEKEADKWERKSMESEVMMTELNTKVKQARRHEDAESICNNNGGEERRKKMVCKVCHVRSTCMLLLPCRHLCCCRGCEGLVMFCPVCETVKNGSLEVFLGLN